MQGTVIDDPPSMETDRFPAASRLGRLQRIQIGGPSKLVIVNAAAWPGIRSWRGRQPC